MVYTLKTTMMDKTEELAEKAYPINADMTREQQLSIIDARKILAKWIDEYAQQVSREIAKKAWDYKAHVDAVLLGDYPLRPNEELYETFDEWYSNHKNQQ